MTRMTEDVRHQMSVSHLTEREGGFILVSGRCDSTGAPLRTLQVRHSDFLPSGDQWEVVVRVRLRLFESVEMRFRFTTEELRQAFIASDGQSLQRNFIHDESSSMLIIPGNAGDYYVVVNLTEEIVHCVKSILGRYGSLQAEFAPPVEET